MASIIKTTAISLRKGDSEANRSFTGILGELVADLGADGTGTDINTTLRLHNGVLQGGIPMCRADFLNISTRQLAVGRDKLGMTGEKNLAYADLSNLEQLTDSTAIQLVLDTLAGYGLAKKAYVDEELLKKANVDFSNIDTADLATAGHGHAGKDLAYADTSNVNTANLTDTTIHNGLDGNKPLAYADASNLDTTNLEDRLAKIDLSNVTKLSLENAIWGTQTAPSGNVDAERTQNKVTTQDLHNINSTVKYPSVKATKDYVDYEVANAGFLRTDYSNTETYDLLYSNAGDHNALNNTYNTLYLPDTSDYAHPTGVVIAGTGFVEKKIYTDSNNTILDPSGTQSDHLKVRILDIDENTNLPTEVEFYQSKGVENIGSGTAQIKVSDQDIVNIPYSCTPTGDGFYTYTAGTPTPAAGVLSGEYSVNAILDLVTPIPLTQLLWMSADNVNAGAIANYVFYPAKGLTSLTDGTYTFSSGSGTAAQVNLKAVHCSNAGGGKLLKTDLSNLLGMSEADQQDAQSRQWRIKRDEEIPAVDTPAANIQDNKYLTLATQGQTWDAIRAAYEYTMGTAISSQNVAAYVKTTLDQYALSDTYRGQVLYYLQNDTNIPTTRPGGAPLQNNDQILLKNKNGVLGGRPYLGTWNGSTWTYEPFVNQDSAQSNGDYVYCLDLGTWDTENYHNASGNITWNHKTQKLDIAPDHDNVPDGITIIKDPVTGQIKLGEYFVPAPEYFTGADTATQVITLLNNVNGTVPFDLYVSGVFQYPNTYSYDPTTRRLTLSFKVENVQNNIVVIYRGIVFNSIYHTLTVVPTPADATVTLDGVERTSINVPAGQSVTWTVSKSGYITQSGHELVNTTHNLPITLSPVPAPTTVTFTINPTPADATVIINGTQQSSITVTEGAGVTWSVWKNGYVSQTGTETVNANTTLNVTLVEQMLTLTILPTPSDASVRLTHNGTTYTTNTLTISALDEEGIFWEVSKPGYISQADTVYLNSDQSIPVTLVEESGTPIEEPTDYNYSITDGTLTLEKYNGNTADIDTPHIEGI